MQIINLFVFLYVLVALTFILNYRSVKLCIYDFAKRYVYILVAYENASAADQNGGACALHKALPFVTISQSLQF